jgi:hypothetical protein
MGISSTMDRLGGAGRWPRVAILVVLFPLAAGCEVPSAHTQSRDYGFRDIPVDPPRLRTQSADDCAHGGHLFKIYCGSCHNARPLGERPFSNYQVAIAHMRDQAYLTGKEYRQIILFLRRWDNVGPPTPPTEPSPKRFVYGQPLNELRPEEPAGEIPPPPAGGGAFGPPGAAAPPQPPQGGNAIAQPAPGPLPPARAPAAAGQPIAPNLPQAIN